MLARAWLILARRKRTTDWLEAILVLDPSLVDDVRSAAL